MEKESNIHLTLTDTFLENSNPQKKRVDSNTITTAEDWKFILFHPVGRYPATTQPSRNRSNGFFSQRVD
jgi:hypothetical protein